MTRLTLRTRKPVDPETEAQRAACDDVAKVYFRTVGLAAQRPTDPRVKSLGFRLKFGRHEFRRAAWERVRDDLRRSMPRLVFLQLDCAYGPEGAGLHFTNQFTFEDRNVMKRMMEATP